MLLATIPGLVAVLLFVATLSLRPGSRARATVLPPPPALPKA
jgi:hypothetical protein